MRFRSSFRLISFQAAPVAAAALAVLLAPGCAGSRSSAPAVQPITFTATPGTITRGGSASLTAVFPSGTGVLNPGNLLVTSGVPVPVSPSAATAYTLTVTSSSNPTVTRTTAVGVANGTGVPSSNLYSGSFTHYGNQIGPVASAIFSNPLGIAADPAGIIYMADGGYSSNGNNTLDEFDAGTVSVLAGIYEIGCVATGGGILYVTCLDNTVLKVTPQGVVTVLAGVSGATGSADGPGTTATFNMPTALAVDANGNVYVADSGNSTIRMITSAGEVSTLAGTPGATGSNDGTGPAAGFNQPLGLAVDGSQNVYVADNQNNTIRMVTSGGVVTTLAGVPGVAGSTDGPGTSATFNSPSGLAFDGAGNLLIVDTNNGNVRMLAANGVVSTVFGSAGSAMDGSAAGNINYLAVDPTTGNLYITFTSMFGAGVLQGLL